jgi:hypothetical protein
MCIAELALKDLVNRGKSPFSNSVTKNLSKEAAEQSLKWRRLCHAARVLGKENANFYSKLMMEK